MQDNDPRDRELLTVLQNEIPITSTPFALIGQSIDMSEKEVIKRAERLKRDGMIRQISAVFDPRSLGYRSCLVAARVHGDKIDRAASVINLHPGVSQNYRRNHEFNLWYSIAVPPSSKLGLEKTIELLADESESDATLMLPTLKLFKGLGPDHEPESDSSRTDEQPLTEREMEYVRALQRDFPLQPRPYEALSRLSTIPPDELLQAAQDFRRRQQLRRISAIVQLRRPFTANAMGVWSVPDEKADEIGTQMASHRAVLQCYLRPRYDNWPYNIFTTVQARSVDECDEVLAEIAESTGILQRQALYPTKEYKRARLAFFSDENDAWEASHLSRSTHSAAS